MTTVQDRLTAALVGRYRIERELGAGGMATVYLAHDVKHARDVAIKVLHPDLGAALGGERFLSEIRTTARLQHPHILALLDSGEADGLLYYVMPYVSGESLRDRLTRERQLPIDEALLIAREVADALGAAHTLGVIHRDIKPDNILLQGGHAVVADFGIALAVQEAGGPRLTQTGLSLGTPAYMSPEQAMGEPRLDARTDVYALGAVMYEMLTGEPPFSGATAQAVVAKVLTERPSPPRAVRDTIPPALEQAVLTALAKLPADRWPSAAKFADALTNAVSEARPPYGAAEVPQPRAARPRTSVATALAVVVGAVALLAAGWGLGRTGRAPDARWTTFTQLTDATGEEASPSLSPDGQSFTYASNARGTWDIYVQRVGGRNAQLVAGDSTIDEITPRFSPDGARIAYAHGRGGLFVMGATGESPRRLTTFGTDPSWSPDGRQIVFSTSHVANPYSVSEAGGLWIVSVDGGEPTRIVDDDRAFMPSWSPDGERIAFWMMPDGQRELATVPVAGGAPVLVTRDVAVDWAPVWAADGRSLYFASDRGGTVGLWRMGVDPTSGEPRGAPELIASGVDGAMDQPQLSRDGRTIIFRSKLESVNPAMIAFDPEEERIGAVTLLQQRTGILTPSDVSPDGEWLALYNAPDRQQDVWLMRTNGRDLTRVTDDVGRDWLPRFTPDGEALTFYSNQDGPYEAYLVRRDGSGRMALTAFGGQGVYATSFTPDGERFVVVRRDSVFPVIAQAPWPLRPGQGQTLRDLAMGDGLFGTVDMSPDGRWLWGVVVRPDGTMRGLALYELATGRRRLLTDDARQEIGWLPDMQRIVHFTGDGALVLQDIESSRRRVLAQSLPYAPDQYGSIVASPDGRALYYGARQVESNIWMVQQGTGEAAPK